MGAQGRRLTDGSVWADWFLELEGLLERRERIRNRYQRQDSRRIRARGHESPAKI
jgi:hypothetical protein